MTNPFAPSTILPDDHGVFADGAFRRRASFVYREIAFTSPFSGLLIYDGWWFRQQISIDGICVWRRISWAVFHKRIEFALPAEVDPHRSLATIDIRFGHMLTIRRFQVAVGGRTVYDEIA